MKRTNPRRIGRWIVRTVIASGLLGSAGLASASGSAQSGGAAFVASVMSVAHLIGIVASLALVYYAIKARRKFTGGVFGESATYVIVGAAMFVVAFLVRELSHGFGVDLVTFAPGMQMKMAINMVLFTITVFAFGWAFYRTASTLQGA